MLEGAPKSAPVAAPWPRHWRMPEFIQSQDKSGKQVFACFIDFQRHMTLYCTMDIFHKLNTKINGSFL